MSDKEIYRIPGACPETACGLGPSEFGPLCGISARRFVATWDELRTLLESEPENSSDTLLCLLYGCEGQADLDVLPARLLGLRADFPRFRPILLYKDLSVTEVLPLIRAGLWDALELPLEASAWTGAMNRFEADSRRRAATDLVRREAAETNRRLHEHRRQLRSEVATVGKELLSAQESLETANQELTDHMNQLSLLYKLGRELSTASNWDAALKGLLESLASFVGAGGAALILRSAPGGSYSPRQTYKWEEDVWDRVIVRLESQVSEDVAMGMVSPGVFTVDAAGRDRPKRDVVALPLEHMGARLGYLLLMQCPDGTGGRIRERYLPFLRTVQVILAEEVAGAQMLDRLREMSSFNTRVLETVGSGIWVVDETGHTIFCNRTGMQLVRNDGDAPAVDTTMVGRLSGPRGGLDSSTGPIPRDLLRGIEHPDILLDGTLRLDEFEGVILKQLFDRGDEPYRGEGSIVRPDGEVIPILVQTSTMDGRGLNEKWLVVVVEDLREARKLEAERGRAAGLESMVEMSATLAHEIRNPLMGLSAQAELLGENLSEGDGRKRYLDVITREVDRINETITRMLNFVRPYEAEMTYMDLDELALDALELVRSRAEVASIDLKFNADDSGDETLRWRQMADGGQIKQVLLNLLINALDVSPEGGRVELKLKRRRQIELADPQRGTSQRTCGVSIEVFDEGPGLGDVDSEKLFQPFFTTKNTGTGLGLSISRKIVRAHRGDITVERRDGRTVFCVDLPQTAEDRKKAKSQEAS